MYGQLYYAYLQQAMNGQCVVPYLLSRLKTASFTGFVVCSAVVGTHSCH